MTRTLTRRIAYSEQFDLFVGIDLGRLKNVAVVIDQHLQRYGRLEFTQDRGGYDDLVAWLKQSRAGKEQPRVLVGMEPTNDYWQWLAAELQEQAIPYRLVNPFTVKKSREGSQLDYAKDDQRDGYTIARLLPQGQYTETQLLAEPYAQMRQYEQAHWQLRGGMRRTKTLLRQNAERLFPELREIFADFTGKTVLALLQNHADPQVITKLSWGAFLAAVHVDFTGQRLMVKKLQKVYQLAPDSIGLQPGCGLQHLVRQQLATLAHQRQQLQELEQALLAIFHALPTAPYLLSLGLGELSTALIAAELGDLSHFRSGKQLVKLAGIQPTPNQSGQYRRRKTPMSHKGRVRLRNYLFFATMRLIRHDPTFRARQEAFVTRSKRPLKRLQGVGALMAKLLHLIWAVCRQQTAYCPQRFAAS